MNIFQLASNKVNTTSDTIGAFASTLCLAHCLLTPLIFLSHAHLGDHDHHESSPLWWGSLDFIFLLLSFVAIRFSAKKTSLKWMPAVLYFAWALLAAFILIEKFHLLHLPHELIYIPALGLVGLHLYNRWHCNCGDE